MRILRAAATPTPRTGAGRGGGKLRRGQAGAEENWGEGKLRRGKLEIKPS